MAGDVEFWREHVATVERDGWVASEYARVHGLSVTALYYWRSKFRAKAPPATAKFVTLTVVPAPGSAPAGPCVLALGAVRLELGALPAPEWLAAVALAAQGAR